MPRWIYLIIYCVTIVFTQKKQQRIEKLNSKNWTNILKNMWHPETIQIRFFGFSKFVDDFSLGKNF